MPLHPSAPRSSTPFAVRPIPRSGQFAVTLGPCAAPLAAVPSGVAFVAKSALDRAWAAYRAYAVASRATPAGQPITPSVVQAYLDGNNALGTAIAAVYQNGYRALAQCMYDWAGSHVWVTMAGTTLETHVAYFLAHPSAATLPQRQSAPSAMPSARRLWNW